MDKYGGLFTSRKIIVKNQVAYVEDVYKHKGQSKESCKARRMSGST